MSVDERSLAAIVRAIGEDPGYRADLLARLQARTVEAGVVEQLVGYARGRQSTPGQARARKLLTDAGISWVAV